MAFNFEIFYTNLKATFETMEKYGEDRSEQKKVITLIENICTTNQELEYAIYFCRSNHNGKYLTVKNYLATQISFIFPAHQPSQQKNCDSNKKSMSHVKKDKLGKTKLCNEVEIYDTTRIFSSKEWIKNRNNPGVLKIIQNCPVTC